MATPSFDDTLKRFEVMEKAKQEKLLMMKATAVVKKANDQNEKRHTICPLKVANRIPLAERTQQIMEEKEQKYAALKKNMEKEKIGKEMDECTFKPSINTKQAVKQNSENQAPAGSRIDAMLKWAEDKNRKIAEITLDKDLKIGQQPGCAAQQSGVKRKLNAKEIEKSTERLYSQRVILEKKKLDLQAKEAEQMRFKPEINKKSIQLAEKRKKQYESEIATQEQAPVEASVATDIQIHDGNDKSVEKVVKPAIVKPTTPSVPKKKPVEPIVTVAKPQKHQPSKSSDKKNSDKKNFFAQDDTTEYQEFERTIDKAVTLFNKDKRKGKDKPVKEKPSDTEDVVNQLKHLCEDIDNLVLMK